VRSTDGQTYAFKRVEMKGSDDVHALVESYSNEIKLLQRLKGNRHIIQLIDHEVTRHCLLHKLAIARV
jgi:hypothetical protein